MENQTFERLNEIMKRMIKAFNVYTKEMGKIWEDLQLLKQELKKNDLQI